MGQLADEPDRITEQDGVGAVQRHLAHGGVQGGEELVFHQHFRPGKEIHDGRFSHVGVADQRGAEALLTALAAGLALQVDPGQLPAQGFDAGADQAAVGFQLGFPGALGADAPHLPGEVSPLPGKAGEQVLQLGQLYLGLGGAGAGVLGKDIQDQGAAVDDFGFDGFFQIADLRRGEVFVEDHRFRLVGIDHLLQLFYLAAADEGGGIQPLPVLHQLIDHLYPGSGSQLLQLAKIFIHLPAPVLRQYHSD